MTWSGGAVVVVEPVEVVVELVVLSVVLVVVRVVVVRLMVVTVEEEVVLPGATVAGTDTEVLVEALVVGTYCGLKGSLA